MASQPWWDIKPTLSAIADEQDRKLQFIWKQLIDPCDAPITVWIWLMWAPFKKLVLAWYSIDLSQVLTAYLRPGFRATRVRSHRHWGGGKRGKRPSGKGGRLNPLEFDPNEFIGNELLGFDELGGIKPYPGEMFIWTIEGIIERVLFYWMVLDLGSDFLYEWTSAVANTKYCHARDDGVLAAIGSDYPTLGILGWDPVGPMSVRKMRHVNFFNGYGWRMDFGPSHFGIVLSATPVPGHVPDPWIELRVRCLSGARTGLDHTVRMDGTDGEELVISTNGIGNGGELWIAETRVNGLWEVSAPVLNCQSTFVP